MNVLVKEYLDSEIKVLQELDIKDIVNVLNILSDALKMFGRKEYTKDE